jgi:menaquinol-cytochrome c reductase iron-sulfur subunit
MTGAPSSPVARRPSQRKRPYTADRGVAGAYEGETVTRRRFMELNALTVGGVASAAFGLPALGFALGPLLEEQEQEQWQDLGSEKDFDTQSYVQVVANLVPNAGEAGKTTVYVRRFDPAVDSPLNKDQPYVVLSTRCAHLGCPVRYFASSKEFVCPCHGGVYDAQGKVGGGPPVRPLDRFYTRVVAGRVQMGKRFSVNSELKRFSPRDPSNHLDGLWQYLYPSRPST